MRGYYQFLPAATLFVTPISIALLHRAMFTSSEDMRAFKDSLLSKGNRTMLFRGLECLSKPQELADTGNDLDNILGLKPPRHTFD
jgi:hypothetical protein